MADVAQAGVLGKWVLFSSVGFSINKEKSMIYVSSYRATLCCLP